MVEDCQVVYIPPSQDEAALIIGLLEELINNQEEILNSQNEGFTSLEDLLNQLIALEAPDPEKKYFSTDEVAISISTPIKPASADEIADPIAGVPGYDRIKVNQTIDRNAPHISIINDGTTALYVLVSHDGQSWTTDENPVLIGEARVFFNVYELRIRSPLVGNVSLFTGGVYRATEYDYWLAYTNVVVNAVANNRAAFTAQSLVVTGNLPGVGINLPAIVMPNGFQLVIRGTPGNAAVVYLANSAVNTGDPLNRITLAAGDVVKLQITNANLVWVASTGAASIDILAEQ
jgi:hypothetical protein